MRYNGPFVSLGNTGLKVSRIAFGCGFRGLPDVKDAQKVVEQAMDTGINFIDCANRYECANSVKAEVALGNALKGRRDDFVITSKVGTPQGNGPNSAGLSRGHILREVEKSLKRLQTDYIDIYLLHIPDEETGIEETLRALDTLCTQGKIRYTGMANYRTWQVVEAMHIQKEINADKLAVVQNPYGLLNRSLERGMFPASRRYSFGIMAYNVLGAGLLGGKYRKDAPMPEKSFWTNSPLYRAYYPHYFRGQPLETEELVRKLSEKYSVPMTAIATSWALTHDEITVVNAGANTFEQFKDYLAAYSFTLEEEDIEKLNTVSYGSDEEFLVWSVEKKEKRLVIIY